MLSVHPGTTHAKSAPEQSSSIPFPQTSVADALIAEFASLQSPLIPCVEVYVAPGEVQADVVEK